MSPSTRYLLWEATPVIGQHVVYRRDLTQRGADTPVWRRGSLVRFVSWSRRGEIAMFLNATDERDDHNPSITFVDAPTASFCELRSKPGKIILAAFWARDGKHVVYETSNTIWSSPGQPHLPVSALGARAFYAAPILRTDRLSLGEPTRLNDSQLDTMLGPAFLPVIKAWERDSGLGRPFDLTKGDRVVLTPDGRKAFLFGRLVHVRAPDWATADKVVAYVAVGRHVTRGLADNHEISDGPIWSCDSRWITYVSPYGWCWLNPSNDRTTVMDWTGSFALPLQFLQDNEIDK